MKKLNSEEIGKKAAQAVETGIVRSVDFINFCTEKIQNEIQKNKQKRSGNLSVQAPHDTSSSPIEEKKADNNGQTNSVGMRKCPFCCETIPADAVKCPFCAEDLSEPAKSPETVRNTPPPENSSVQPPVQPVQTKVVIQFGTFSLTRGWIAWIVSAICTWSLYRSIDILLRTAAQINYSPVRLFCDLLEHPGIRTHFLGRFAGLSSLPDPRMVILMGILAITGYFFALHWRLQENLEHLHIEINSYTIFTLVLSLLYPFSGSVGMFAMNLWIIVLILAFVKHIPGKLLMSLLWILHFILSPFIFLAAFSQFK